MSSGVPDVEYSTGVSRSASRCFRTRKGAELRNIDGLKDEKFPEESTGKARREANLQPPEETCRVIQAMHIGKSLFFFCSAWQIPCALDRIPGHASEGISVVRGRVGRGLTGRARLLDGVCLSGVETDGDGDAEWEVSSFSLMMGSGRRAPFVWSGEGLAKRWRFGEGV